MHKNSDPPSESPKLLVAVPKGTSSRKVEDIAQTVKVIRQSSFRFIQDLFSLPVFHKRYKKYSDLIHSFFDIYNNTVFFAIVFPLSS